MRTLLAGGTIELAERDGFWRASVPNLGVGDYTARFLVEGSIKAAGTLPVRVTDGRFWKLNPQRRLFELGSQPEGPLSGSYQGNVFVRDAGRRSESLVQGQAGWNRWERKAEPGEHLLYWESLTAAELDQRFAYLDKFGWDLLHVCQHWGIWERLDAGGRIAPHGAEQISLYLRTAARHHLAVIQALTHYEYLAATRAGHGTVPFSTYLDAGMQTDDFFSPPPATRGRQVTETFFACQRHCGARGSRQARLHAPNPASVSVSRWSRC